MIRDGVLLLQADARQIPLPDGFVQCVVTSPPYWGLRDYGHGRQIGLEATPELYVQSLVEVFREVRRVLRDDGTVWLNLGDSYARTGGTDKAPPRTARAGNTRLTVEARGDRTQEAPAGTKPKDLIGIPWRVAFALQADGWYLRSDIIWAKPNPMPESVTDRPTKAHEYLFLLTKRERYYYDVEGAKEPSTSTASAGNTRRNVKGERGRLDGLGTSVPWHVSPLRNARSVWTITTKPYAGAHFATFPPELPERCLKAGTPEGGCCAACGSPYKRLVEKGEPNVAHQQACGADAAGGYQGTAQKDYAAALAQDPSATKARILAGMVEHRTVGWTPTCGCDQLTGPAASVVLDPFCGSGTVGTVCQQRGLVFVGLDAKREYLQLAQQRLGYVDEATA